MKSLNSHNKPRTAAVIGLFILLALLAMAIITTILRANNNPPIDTGQGQSSTGASSDTPEPAPAVLDEESANSKQSLIEQTNDSSNESSQATAGTLAVSASQATQSVTVVTKLSTITDGLCALSATNQERTYTASADIIYQSTYSTCAGFSIPVSELGYGKWDITVKATSLANQVANGTTTIEVAQ